VLVLNGKAMATRRLGLQMDSNKSVDILENKYIDMIIAVTLAPSGIMTMPLVLTGFYLIRDQRERLLNLPSGKYETSYDTRQESVMTILHLN
jgi:hypothetical protein